jgi:hypothetical protein
MKFFNELGALIEQRWRDQNYDKAAFPDIAATALDAMPPHQHLEVWEIIRWAHTSPQLPRQMDVEGRFGDPPITLFAGPRFYIDIYFWLDGTTTIHQHAFSGAFQLIKGSSLHSLYEFKEEVQINEHLALGEVRFNNVELLEVGQTRKILSGRRFIHSLFHLDRPSATITVRTQGDIQAQPQWDYLKPYLARDPFFREEAASKKLQSLALLFGMKHPEIDRFVGDLLGASDFQTAVAILDLAYKQFAGDAFEQAFQMRKNEGRFQAFLELARKRHGQRVDLLPPVFDELKRQEGIIQRRQFLTGAEHRFFLALLLNVPQKRLILDLVKERFPKREALETIGEWLTELSTTKVFGSSEPNVLGIEDFDEESLFVFQKMIAGLSSEQIREAIDKEFAPDDAEDLQADLETIGSRLRQAALFKAIFSETL